MAAADRTQLGVDPWRHAELQAVYSDVRAQSVRLAEPLAPEDYVVQSMPDVSPTKWHLAHTTWFFETFVLAPFKANFRPHHEAYAYLFNSYYEGAGPRHTRAHRGVLSRPTVNEVYEYRRAIDEQMLGLMDSAPSARVEEILTRVTIGLHHEQQHQELLLMDIKHVLAQNPLYPVYSAASARAPQPADAIEATWSAYEGGVFEIGHADGGFCFDNERPRHKAYVSPFSLCDRRVTNQDLVGFIEDGGYRRPELWLSDGWHTVQTEGWTAPLYWINRGGEWMQFTLHGLRSVDTAEPVAHVSFYEADAFARWSGHRLPTEAEWEVAAAVSDAQPAGHFLTDGRMHPEPEVADGPSTSLFGNVWTITQSAYLPYPGFKPLDGTLGEYNGKFMSSQVVTRGGSCLTPQGHTRRTYRNYFYPHQRWCAQGIRLASDAR